MGQEQLKENLQERGQPKFRVGVVTSDKMDKTVVVSATSMMQHPTYGKFIKRSRKYYAHDETNQCGVGDKVRIIESRPLSKLKRWRVQEVIEKAL